MSGSCGLMSGIWYLHSWDGEMLGLFEGPTCFLAKPGPNSSTHKGFSVFGVHCFIILFHLDCAWYYIIDLYWEIQQMAV